MTGPLSGIRVLDLTTNIAGPCTTMVLGDLGADIIKVERPDGGDDARQMGPYRADWGAYFVAINRGKRSLALDIRRPEGRSVIHRLAERSDVFIESFRGGKAAGLGLDENAVRQLRPDIIYASLSSYGPRGPEYEKPGYDALLQARTGILSVTGTLEGPPVRAGVSLLDMGSGVWVALGIIAALFERQRSGQGQKVDGSLFQTGVMWMAYHIIYQQFTGQDPTPQGTRHPAFAPYGDFPAADGRLLIGISNDRLFARLCEVLERSDWIHNPRFRTNADRVRNRIRLDQEIARVMRTQPISTWLKKCHQSGVPVSPVQTTGQLLKDPQLKAIDQLQSINLPNQQEPPVWVPHLPIEFSVTRPDEGKPPPRLGQHGQEILIEAGFSAQEVQALVRRGIIRLASSDGEE